MKIRAVIFDFGGVICFPPRPAQWQEAASFCGADPAALQAAFWTDRDGYDAGEDARVYWRSIAARLGLAFDDVMIGGMISREIAFWSRFDDRVLRWAGDLRAAGILTGILSNLPRPLGEALKTLPGFLGHFDQVTFSYELGVLKPEAAIYHNATGGLQVAPAEALFLDDRSENVAGARASGLQAELFTSWEDFLARGRERYGLPAPER
jgi:putative hydrolase of the HAD superfamily